MKPWTAKEITFLKEHGAELTLGEAAQQLGRTCSSVEHKLRFLKVTPLKPQKTVPIVESVPALADRKPQGSKWTQEEVYFVEANRGKMTVAQLAEQLGRSVKAVKSNIKFIDAGERFGDFNRDALNCLEKIVTPEATLESAYKYMQEAVEEVLEAFKNMPLNKTRCQVALQSILLLELLEKLMEQKK